MVEFTVLMAVFLVARCAGPYLALGGLRRSAWFGAVAVRGGLPVRGLELFVVRIIDGECRRVGFGVGWREGDAVLWLLAVGG